MADKIDANLVGFAIAEEASAKVLPTNPVFRTREPNSFDDFGGNYSMTARRPFSPSRQNKKGVITDLDADGGFNEDVTMGNMQWLLQGFFFADLRKTAQQDSYLGAFSQAFTAAASDVVTINAHGLQTGDGPFRVSSTTTLPAGLTAGTDYWVVRLSANTFNLAASYANAVADTPVVVDITDAGTGTHTMARPAVADAANDDFTINNPANVVVGSLVIGRKFTNAANNGVHLVNGVTGGHVSVASSLADEAVPPVGASLQVCGYQFDTATVDITTFTGGFALTRASGTDDYTTLGLVAGQWVFIGGDSTDNRFTNNIGYARIALDGIDADEIRFDKSTFTPQAETGTGKDIRMFFGDMLRNEDDPDLIVTRYYRTQRSLGRDANGIQSENLEGAVANEMTWTSPLPGQDAKVNVDLSYVAMTNTRRTGTDGLLSSVAGTTLLAALGEDAINTAKNVYRLRMNIVDPATLNPTPLFARVTEWSITVNNNVSPAKAQGVLGAFDMNVGRFDVTGEITAYFSTVEAIGAIEDNSDVTFDAIYSRDNRAIIYDLPLVALGGGRLEVEQDQAIMVPLETNAAESPFGFTAALHFLPYVPNAGVA